MMAEETVKHRVFNTAEGPRGIAKADGRIVTVMPGQVSDYLEFNKRDIELAKDSGLEFKNERFTAPNVDEAAEDEEARNAEAEANKQTVKATGGFTRPAADKIPSNSLSAESAKAAENVNKTESKKEEK